MSSWKWVAGLVVLLGVAALFVECNGEPGPGGMSGANTMGGGSAESSSNSEANAPDALLPAENVDLKRYMGKWYEIARYPNSFQKGLVAVIAEYRLKDDGDIDVSNTGRRKRLDGSISRSTARGWLQEKGSNSKWWVQFVWPFKADYWIIDLCPEYSYAVVGQPDREYLWILSRTPKMDDATYSEVCRRLTQQGYDPSRLRKTPQPPA